MKSFPDSENKVYKSRFFFFIRKIGKGEFEDEKAWVCQNGPARQSKKDV